MIPQTLLDPSDPLERQRDVGPAFLKPLPRGAVDFLPCLLTILHSIPRCRAELLSLGDDLTEWYGFDKEWWKGARIDMSTVTMDGSTVSPESPNLDILYETQRLMAFLSETKRAYGSAEALTQVAPVHISTFIYSGSDLLRFLLQWEEAFLLPESGTARSVPSMFKSRTTRESLTGTDFTMGLPVQQLPSWPDASLYDALDALLFGAFNDPPNLFEVAAPVILISLPSTSIASANALKIPSILNLDRYMEKNKHLVHQFKSASATIAQEVAGIETQIAALTQFKLQRSTGMVNGDASKLIAATMSHLKGTILYLTERPVNSIQQSPAETAVPSPGGQETAEKAMRVLSQLERIDERVKQRLEGKNAAP